MSTVAEMVERLVVQDDGQPPLLLRLWAARQGDVQAGSKGSASSKHAVPINVGAVDLWNRIVTGNENEVGVIAQYEAAFGPLVRRIPAPDLLHLWHSRWAIDVARGEVNALQVVTAEKLLSGWVSAIREHFEPKFKRSLRDVACPNCGVDWFVTGEGEGTTTTAALVAFLTDGDELAVRCIDPKCIFHDGRDAGQRSVWTGVADVVYLGRQAGYDMESLAGAIRDARTPVAVAEYDPLEGATVTVTPEDDAFAAEIAGVR